MSSANLIAKGQEASSGDESVRTEGSSTSPARTPTLSWQRRPASRGGARPLSMVAAENATQRSLAADTSGPTSAVEETFSKHQIAQALESKDASWFRQTADRGQNSAAYRRNQVEDGDRSDMSSSRTQLPGLAESRAASDVTSADQAISVVTSSRSNITSPVTLNPSRFDDPSGNRAISHEPFASSGKESPTRSPSPTKGLGGFVQSAMMKRSDSVKRWSVTSPPGLTRADSVAAARGNHDRASTQTNSRPSSMIRGTSTPTSSRPTSRQGDQSDVGDAGQSSNRGSIGGLSHKSERDEDSALPTSPSKTMDPRRWSPTKSSWLESALNRPESPKPSPTTAQPTWREKAAMEAARATAASHRHQVSIGGLMRQSALGTVAKSNPTGLGGIYSPPANANRPVYGSGSTSSTPQKAVESGFSNKENESRPEGTEGETANPLAERAAVRRVPSIGSPPVKPKPQTSTPAIRDFRSGLRQRPADRDGGKSDEPEFKNVFGSLRKTKTQNYVAPDELKNNILRGKAALNLTNGPQKSERRDEFKDAILKKKADFKTAQAEGRGVVRKGSIQADHPVPEGLVKRAELGRTAAATSKQHSPVETNVGLRDQSSEDLELGSATENILRGSAGEPVSPKTTSPTAESPGGETLTRVATEPQTRKADLKPRSPPPLQKESSAPSRLPTQGRTGGGGGSLADRFNPALAGLLARGPPPNATNGVGRSDDLNQTNESGSPASSAPGPQLTHMTKNRARGPRRKAPTSSAPPASSDAGQTALHAQGSTQVKGSPQEISSPEPNLESKQSEAPKPARKPAGLSLQEQAAAKAIQRGQPSTLSAKPAEPAKSPEPRMSRPLSQRSAKADETTRPSEAKPAPPPSSSSHADDAPLPSSPKKLNMKRLSRFLDDDAAESTRHESPKETARLGHQRTGSRSPVKMQEPASPAKSDRDTLPSMRTASPRLGARSPTKSKPAFEDMEIPAGLNRKSTGLSATGAVASPARSPTKPANEISTLLTDFFGPPPQSKKELTVDPAQILMSRPATSDRVTSLGLQMFQILGDGKKLPVSPQNERVLFDKEMYVCAHNFTRQATGKKVFEVYFWVGDEVPEAAAEDAQLFVAREARSLGGTLVQLRQGKESAEFVQALGGVIMVRRGSSNKYDSLAPNMLCGRRYLGQVAFDEVPFSPDSLCAGFTYLVTKGGSCYMWNGKGSHVAEVSCARLIGMDLTLTGELIEYEDGSEPPSFWHLFDGHDHHHGDAQAANKPHSADHWRLKPSYDKYGSRLFCSDANSRQQVRC